MGLSLRLRRAVAAVFCQRLAAFVHDPTRRGVRDSLVVPVIHAVDQSMKSHPTPALPMKIVANRLFDERSLFTGVPPLGRELAVKS